MGTYPYQYKQNTFIGNTGQVGSGLRIDATTEKTAITFTSNGGNVKKYGFFVNTKAGTTGTFNIQVVKCTNSGTPTAVNVSDATTDLTMTAITTNKWVSGVFANQFALTQGSVYALLVSGKTGQSASIYILVKQFTPLGKMRPDETNDQKHSCWFYGGSWENNNYTSPFILLSSTNGYVDGKMHEHGGLTLFKANSTQTVGEQIKFPSTVVATSISFFYDWARSIENPGSTKPLSYKIYNNSGTLLASAGMTYPSSFTSGNWYTYTLKSPLGVATTLTFTGGQIYTILAKCASDTGSYGFGMTQSFLNTVNPITASNLYKYAKWGTSWAYAVSTTVSTENLWGTFKTYNNATNGYYDMAFKLGSPIISGKVLGNLNTSLPGAKVKLKSNNIVISSAGSNSTGNFSFSTDYTGNLVLDADYGDWELTGKQINVAYPLLPTATITQTTESKWWNNNSASGIGRHFAFRNKITFATPHATVPFGYVATVGFQTGSQKVIATDGWFNESISGHGQIDYKDGYTYFCFRNKNAKSKIIQYNRATGLYLSTVFNNFDLSDNDTHFLPAIKIDNDGYVYVFITSHGNTYIGYYKSDLPHNITGTFSPYAVFFDKFFIGEGWAPGAAYLRPRIRPTDKKIYVFFRGGAGLVDINDGNKSTQGFIAQDSSSSSGFSYGKFFATDYVTGSGPVKRKAIYSFGNQFDNNGYCHSLCDYVYGYLDSPSQRWNYSLNYMYSPDMKNWYNINGSLLGESTINAYALNNVMCCTSDGQLWRVTTLAYSASTATRGCNSESLSITPYKWYNGTHTVYLPFMVVASAINDVGGDLELCAHYYNTSLSSWKNYNISKATGIHGTFGNFTSMVKSNGEYNIFAVVSTNNGGLRNRENFGSDLIRFYSTSNPPNKGWKYEIIDSNNIYGNGNLCLKNPPFSNKEIELIYARGSDIVYHHDKSDYGYIRKDGNDLRVVYKGSEIPRHADYFNNKSSKIYFKIQKSIPSTYIFDTAGNYYLYYGNQATTVGSNASANPRSIYSLFENFETYNNKYSLDTSVGVKYYTKTGTSSNKTFQIFSNTVDGVTIGGNVIFPSWYNAYSGLKFCAMGDPNNSNTSTVYMNTTVGTNVTDSIISGRIRKIGANTGVHTFIGIKTNANSVYAIGKTSTAGYGSYSYFNNSIWQGMNTNNKFSYGYETPVKIDISSVNGLKFYMLNSANNEVVLGSIPGVRYFNKFIFGSNNAGSQNLAYFDYITIGKKIH